MPEVNQDDIQQQYLAKYPSRPSADEVDEQQTALDEPQDAKAAAVLSDQQRFFLALFDGLDGDVEVRHVRFAGGAISKFISLADPDWLQKLCAAVAKLNARGDGNTYVGMATRKGGGKKKHVRRAIVGWADLDRGTTLDELLYQIEFEANLPQPSFVIRTSFVGTPDPNVPVEARPAKFHAEWLLDDPFDLTRPGAIADFENILRGIAALVDGDRNVVDASRILRPPMTTNRPNAEKVAAGQQVARVETVLSTGKRYSLGDFDAAKEKGAALARVVSAGKIGSAADFDPDEKPPKLVELLKSPAFAKLYAREIDNDDDSDVDFAIAMRAMESTGDGEQAELAARHSRAEHVGDDKALGRDDYWARLRARVEAKNTQNKADAHAAFDELQPDDDDETAEADGEHNLKSLVAMVRALAEKLGRTPTPAEFVASGVSTSIIHSFGGWSEVSAAAFGPKLGESDPFPPPTPEPPKPVGVSGWGDDPVVEGPNAPLYEMNRRYCVLREGGKAVIYERMAADDPQPYERHFQEGLRLLLKNRFLERTNARGQTVGVPLVDAWLEWPRRRTARGVAFDPSRTIGPEYLNTWDGWAIEPDASQPWPLLRELIEEVLTGGVPGGAEYVFDWCAHLFQRPWEPSEVAIVYRGGRGVGKGTFLEGVLKTIAGRHGMQISSGLTRTFNAHLRDTVYLFADEAFWAGDKKSEGILKGMVTERNLVIEPKGIDAYQAPNRLHIAIASNEDWVVPAGVDERRFAIFDTSSARKDDFAFWKALRAEMAAGGIAGFMAAMLARDLSGWHPREGVPQTRALVDQKLESLDPFETRWMEWLMAGSAPTSEYDAEQQASWADGPIRLEAKDLQAAMRAQMGRGPAADRAAAAVSIGRRLRRLCPAARRERSGPGRTWVYLVPTLAEARAAFEKAVGAVGMGLFDE